MKKFTMILASALGLAVLAPATADAGGHKRGSYVTVDGRGYTFYYEYRCVGRDRDGCPIYRWVVVRSVPPCHGHGHTHSHGHRHGHGHGGISIHIGR